MQFLIDQSLFNDMIASDMILLGTGEGVRYFSLVLGAIAIIVGVGLMFAHKQIHADAMETEKKERNLIFESRKFRRRTAVSALLTSVGCMLAALFWVTDAKVFSIFILLILSMLLGILAIATFDMFSVGLQTLTRTDDAARKAMVDEYLRQRKKAAAKENEEK